MIAQRYAEERIQSALDEIDRLKDSDFPHNHPSEALDVIKDTLLARLASPHELPGLVRCVWRLRGGCFWLECWTTPTIPPDPQYREPMPEDLVSQRCA